MPSDQSKDYYFILRETGNTEPVLIEYGFLDNVRDANKLKEYYQNYAEAVVRALSSYIGFNYTLPSGENTYVVKRGDTLYSIANRFGLTVNELKNLNNLSGDALSVGQILKINNQSITNGNYDKYTVKIGDSLYKIAQIYNTSVDNLKRINNLDSDMLMIGQILNVPKNNLDSNNTSTYTVRSGDTIYSIARQFNITPDELKSLNNLTSNLLSIGQVLVVSSNNQNDQGENPAQYLEHIITKGDTLYSLAETYNTTVDEIKKLNNLSNNILSVGQILLIPLTNNPQLNITYTVKRGDSLYSIAKNYGVTVNAIKSINNLTSNLLSIGQQLLIPV